jgi:hypothetical protein
MSSRPGGTRAEADEACPGCFLFERRGVCPMARPGYDWQHAAVAYRQAEELRRAVLEDSEIAPTGLIELVRREAADAVVARQMAQRALPGASLNTETDPRKEYVNVYAARSLRQR